MHYYSHHIGDFLRDTGNLSNEQMAVYLKMIWRYYMDERPLDDDCESIAFAVRSDEKTVRQLLKHYFYLADDGWHHKRCDHEIAEFRSKSSKARDSANVRWKNANAMRTHSEPNAKAHKNDANQEPITNNQVLPPKSPRGGYVKTAVERPDDVSETVWVDFLAHRKVKKSPVTETVVNSFRREASKAGVSLEEAMRMCCSRGWQGFEASWLGAPNGGRGNPAFGNGVAL